MMSRATRRLVRSLPVARDAAAVQDKIGPAKRNAREPTNASCGRDWNAGTMGPALLRGQPRNLPIVYCAESDPHSRKSRGGPSPRSGAKEIGPARC
jgi:hypothetical protein